MIIGVLEVHPPPLGVGQTSVFQDLQKHVEHIGMGFLDLVEQHDGVGFTSGFSPSAARLRHSPHIREATRPDVDTVCFSMYSDMSSRIMAFSSPNIASAKAFAEFGLPNAGRTQENEGADRTYGDP